MVITVNKIGTGTELDLVRPDIEPCNWRVVEERESEFDIEILEEFNQQ